MRKGWQTKTLGALCRFIDYRGKTPEKTNSGLRLITAKNVKMGYLQETPMEFVAPDSYDSWMTRGIPEIGDVLFTTEAPLANVAQLDTDEKVVFAQRVIVLQPSAKDLDRTFLKYLLLSDIAQKRILEQGTGATVQGIKASLLKTIPIEFPPLSEQRRIVGLLDEAFAGLATAKANAEKNLQNARALFESHLHSVFTQRGTAWTERTLEEVAATDCTLSYGIVQPGEEYPDGLPIVRPTDLTTKVIRLDGLKRIDPELAGGYTRTALVGGELLLCVRGSTGGVSIAAAELEGANVTRGIVPIRFAASALTPDFGFYLMSSSAVQDQIRAKTYGAALMQINIRDLRNIRLSFPPLTEQKPMAANLDDLHQETQRLAAIYEQKLAALEALKKSLLHQAFAGNL